MGQGGHWNRAGRRSGGTRPVLIAAQMVAASMYPGTATALAQLQQVMRETGAKPEEIVNGAYETGHVRAEDRAAVLKWLRDNP